MQQPNSFILKYEEENKILGCVYLKKENDKLYLGMLTVSPQLQNKGIGKILLNASEDEARKKNCKALFMSVISKRTELINWYKKHGYYDTGITKPFPENDPRFGIPKTKLEFIMTGEKNLTRNKYYSCIYKNATLICFLQLIFHQLNKQKFHLIMVLLLLHQF